MARFFVILLQVVRSFFWISLALGAYAWLWLPRFQRGSVGGPYWLMTGYDRVIPFLLGIGLAGFLVLWLFNGVTGVFKQKQSPVSQDLRTTFWWLAAVALVSGIPSFLGHYGWLQSADFSGDHYHLLQRSNGNITNYLVVNCADPVGLWCHTVLVTDPFPAPPPTPTPMPETIEMWDETAGAVITVTPMPVPTSTPPARLITDTLGIELSLQVGGVRALITDTLHLEQTPTAPVADEETP